MSTDCLDLDRPNSYADLPENVVAELESQLGYMEWVHGRLMSMLTGKEPINELQVHDVLEEMPAAWDEVDAAFSLIESDYDGEGRMPADRREATNALGRLHLGEKLSIKARLDQARAAQRDYEAQQALILKELTEQVESQPLSVETVRARSGHVRNVLQKLLTQAEATKKVRQKDLVATWDDRREKFARSADVQVVERVDAAVDAVRNAKGKLPLAAARQNLRRLLTELLELENEGTEEDDE